jgi:hypothetical protein
MRRLARVILAVLLLASAYAAWPLYTALQIRDAMIAGDTATLRHTVDWDALRVSLKASLSPAILARLEADPNTPRPSLWQRIASAVAPRLAGGAVDRYVTPERLPVLVGYRRFWRGTVQPALGRAEPATAFAATPLAGTALDRFVAFWRRLRSAVFRSPTRIEIEVRDSHPAARPYRATLEFRGLGWKLTGLAIAEAGL